MQQTLPVVFVHKAKWLLILPCAWYCGADWIGYKHCCETNQCSPEPQDKATFATNYALQLVGVISPSQFLLWEGLTPLASPIPLLLNPPVVVWQSFLCYFKECGACKTICWRLVKFTQISSLHSWNSHVRKYSHATAVTMQILSKKSNFAIYIYLSPQIKSWHGNIWLWYLWA